MDSLDIELASYEIEGEQNKLTKLPEKSMLVALLQRAVLDLRDKDPKIREDALYWFTSKESYDGNVWGTYTYVCDNLDIEKQKTLRRYIIRNYHQTQIKKPSNGKKPKKLSSIRRRRS